MRQIRGNNVRLLVSILMAASCALAILVIYLADLSALENLTISTVAGEAFGMIICTIIFVSISKDRLRNTNTKAFLVLLVLELSLLFWDIIGWLYDGVPSMYLLNMFLNHYLYAALLLIPFTFWMYLCEMYRGGELLNVLYIPMRVIVIAGLAVVVCNLFTGVYFTIDPETGWYMRSDTFYLSYLAPGMEAVICSALILSNEKELRRKIVFLAYVLVPLVAAIMQVFHYGTSLQYLMMMLMLVAMYANIYLGRSGDLIRYESEMTEQRAAVMVSQIQPHFLYNALTAIMNIKGNPPETRDAIADFGHYMRKNLDSLGQVNPIPVARELDHVDSYIQLLKQKYADRIDVRIDAQDNGFFIPPLTIKIILEQAIKYNLHTGGTVRMDISCRKENGIHIISIIDREPSEMSKEFVGMISEDIEVLRKRLETLVGGEIDNVITPDGSIECTITVPGGKEGVLWT